MVYFQYRLCSLRLVTRQGRSQDFSKGGGGGHRGYSPDYIWYIPLLSPVYQWAQSYYPCMKVHIN